MAALFLLSILLCVLIIILFSRVSTLEKRIETLERQHITEKQPVQSALQTPEPVSRQEPATLQSASPSAAASTASPAASAAATAAANPKPSVTPKAPVVFASVSTWKKIEAQLLSNWTGILGAVILTAGFGFLAVYGALSLSPMYRFFMMIVAAGIIYGLSLYLQSKPDWQRFSSWLTAVSGAVVLVACFAAVSVPGVLWVTNDLAALGLVLAGVLVNLIFSYMASKQVFASLHLLLSLLVLMLLPPALPVLISAGMVTFAGVLLAARSRWEFQAGLCMAAFALFHIVRYLKITDGILPDDASFDWNRWLSLFMIAVIGAAALLQHYRKIFQNQPATRPLLAHLTHWISICVVLVLYAGHSKWNVIVFGVPALFVFAVARHGRRLGLLWLYRTDTLVAQMIMLFGLFTLTHWQLANEFVLGLLYIESLALAVLLNREKESILEMTVGMGAVFLGLVWIILSDSSEIDLTNVSNLIKVFGPLNLLVLMIVVSAAARWLMIHEAHHILVNFYSILFGLFVVVFYTWILPSSWAEMVSAGMALFLFVPYRYSLKRTVQHSDQIDQKVNQEPAPSGSSDYRDVLADYRPPLSIFIFLLISVLILITDMFGSRLSSADPVPLVFLHGSPFLLLTSLLLIWPSEYLHGVSFRFRTAPVVWLISFALVFFVYRLVASHGPFLSGFVYAVVSLLGLWAALFVFHRQRFVNRWGWKHSLETGRHVIYASACFLILFVVRHIVISLQTGWSHTTTITLLIEIFGLAVIFCWYFVKSPVTERATGSDAKSDTDFEPTDNIAPWFWLKCQPLFLELGLFFLILMIDRNVSARWTVVVYSFLPAVFLLVSRLQPAPKLKRLFLYGAIFYWWSVLHLAFLSATSAMPSSHFLDKDWIAGLVAVGFLFFDVFLFTKYTNEKELKEVPASFFIFSSLKSQLLKRRNLLIFDPFFLSVALFLYWSFDKAVLTLLWIALIGAVFALSILLREGHFRIISLIALAFALLRLVFFDLSRSSTLTRAVVFLGVGVVMLVMNSLYNKYKDRFEQSALPGTQDDAKENGPGVPKIEE